MDKLRALQAFVAIVDQGSLTRAATALDSSLPAMVRQLAALEADLGVRLLNRTTRTLSLTEDGRQYLARVRTVLADLEEADRALADDRSEPRGTLRVTAPVLFGSLHVAPLVQSFLARYREMRVELLLLDRVVDLVDEGVDVGVRIADLGDSSSISQAIAKMRQVVVASPAFLKRAGVPRHPRDLVRHNCIRFGDHARWGFVDGEKPLQVAIKGDFSCNLTMPVVAACVAGRGFGLFLSYQVAAEIRAKALRVVLTEFEQPPRSVSIVYPSARLLPRRTRAFVDWMKRGLKERAPELVPSGP